MQSILHLPVQKVEPPLHAVMQKLKTFLSPIKFKILKPLVPNLQIGNQWQPNSSKISF